MADKRHTSSRESDKVLTEGWEAGVVEPLLLERVNQALAGFDPPQPPISRDTMVRRAHTLRLQRPIEFRDKTAGGKKAPKPAEECPPSVLEAAQKAHDKALLQGTRDGGPSTVMLTIKSAIRDVMVCVADPQTVYTWGKENVKPPITLKAINDAREAWQLPKFEIRRKR